MMRKKIVVFGGGTGLSNLLSGLKEYPVDITAIIAVSDTGSSTGKLREEFHIPAVGDIRKTITSLSSVPSSIKEMLEYRFQTTSDLNGHALGNLMLLSLLQTTGSLKNAILALSDLLSIEHKVLPLSESSTITLMAQMNDRQIVEGEENITTYPSSVQRLFYKEEPTIVPEVIDAISEADLLVFSMGSLYTSVLPHLLSSKIIEAIDKSSAPLMYVCNIVTQPGETDRFSVGDHVKLLNQYLGNRKLDVVIASNSKISQELIEKYSIQEQKQPVLIDYDVLSSYDIELIEADLLNVEQQRLRHDNQKLSFLIFSYLMRW